MVLDPDRGVIRPKVTEKRARSSGSLSFPGCRPGNVPERKNHERCQSRDLRYWYVSHVQTFLPFPDARLSAQCLDNRRLGKQRSEVFVLLRALLCEGVYLRWKMHPCAKMWRGHEEALACYGIAVCKVWVERGFADTVSAKINDLMREKKGEGWFDRYFGVGEPKPPWWGDPRLHDSHQNNLVRKDPDHYQKYFSCAPHNHPYFWPVT